MPRTPKQFEEIREKTRGKILEHSLRLFAEKGYHGTSISDIAKAAGISKGLVYNYFESKEQLVHAIFDLIIELGQEYEKILGEVDDPYEKIRIALEYTFDYIEKNEEFWRLYVSFALQPAIMDTAKASTKEFNDRMFKMITAVFKRIGIQNPKTEAYILGAIIDGVSLDYFFDRENYPLKSVRKRIIEKYSKKEMLKLKK